MIDWSPVFKRVGIYKAAPVVTFQYKIRSDLGLVHIEHNDPFDMEEIQLSFDELFADPDYKTGFDLLRDCSKATLPDNWTYERFASTGAARMVENSKKLGKCRVAWVMHSLLDFGRGNQASIILADVSETIERRPFLNLEDALEWLGIPKDALD